MIAFIFGGWRFAFRIECFQAHHLFPRRGALTTPDSAVSMGEAGQAKSLLVLDEQWQPLDAIPLDLGPRHFTLSRHAPVLPDDLRPGDRKVNFLSDWVISKFLGMACETEY